MRAPIAACNSGSLSDSPKGLLLFGAATLVRRGCFRELPRNALIVEPTSVHSGTRCTLVNSDGRQWVRHTVKVGSFDG